MTLLNLNQQGKVLKKLRVVSRNYGCLAAVLFIVGLSCNPLNTCFAQSAAQPRWMGSTTTKVKPEKRAEFEGYLKHLVAAYRKAGTLWFLTLETFAGDITEYTTVVPIMKFGDLDGPNVVIKILGEAGWARLSRNMARCYTAQTRQYATPQTELEINHTDASLGSYWVETRTLVAPGRLGDYLNWLRSEYRPALEKAGVARFQVFQPIFGARAGEVVTMRMLRNLAEIDGGSVLSRALGDEAVRAIVAKSITLVSSSSARIVQMRTDLSYLAPNGVSTKSQIPMD